MKKEQLHTLFSDFAAQKIIVIGDVMVDSYVWGNVQRISPEAPVPVVEIKKKENRLGGASNVALNLKALGATPILCSVIGNDLGGEILIELLEDLGLPVDGIVQSNQRHTTVKTRIIGNNHQMIRLDEEQTDNISSFLEEKLSEAILSVLNKEKIGAIIFEDYDKGVITEKLISRVVEEARKKNVPVAVDPKKRNFLSYRDVTLFKPNLRELKEGLKVDFDHKDESSLHKQVHALREKLGAEKILLTLSEDGVLIAENSGVLSFPAHVRKIADVSGAGDTVISVASLCLALGLSNELVARLSNLAGGLVCEKVGVVPIDKDLLLAEAERDLCRS